MPDFKDILSRITDAIDGFNAKIPASQKAMLNAIEEEVKRLDLRNGRIKTTVANLKIVASIKAKMLRLVLNPDYVGEVKQFVQAFRDVTTLQNEYWKSVETAYKPPKILKQIRKQAIQDTVGKLGDAGIGVNIGDQIASVLNTNITTGGSYASLTDQLRELLTDTKKSGGLLTRYAKQVTVDSLNTYARTVNQVISSDLGFEWMSYRGSEIKTSREFCQSMVEGRRYFHVSEIPSLLRAENMYYIDNYDGKKKKVRINPKTDLPYGFIEGTNAENFLVRAAGYLCAHSPTGVPERNVPQDVKDRVYATPAYQAWKRVNP